MSIRTKLILGFLVVSLIGALIGSVGIVSLNSAKVADSESFNSGTEGIIVMLRTSDAYERIRVAVRDAALAANSEQIQNGVKAFRSAQEKFNKGLSDYGATLANDEDKTNYSVLKAASVDFIELYSRVLDLGIQGKGKEANDLLQLPSSAKIRAEMDGIVQKMIDFNVKYTTDLFHENLTNADFAILLMLILLVGGILASITLGLLVTNSIVKPVRRVNAELSAASQSLESASTQVSASSQQLSSSSSELASSIEEMTSSLEELQSIIEANTKNVNQSELFMQETSAGSKKVTEGMVSLREALSDISGQSKKIFKIIKVIDDIAFQTNILALNAAVEAARAGDAGRGFAVVADQVKALAQKSADAAKETSDLIETAMALAGKGEVLGSEVNEIQIQAAEKAGKVAVLLDEVNRASKEQLKGANQINQAVTQINTIVQTTASSSEENASAGEELQSQAESLAGNVEDLAGIINGHRKQARERGKNRGTHRVAVADQEPRGRKSLTAVPAPSRTPGIELTRPEDIIPLKDFKDF